MKRRSLLTLLGGSTVSLAGCLSWRQSSNGGSSCGDQGTISLVADAETFTVSAGDESTDTFGFTLTNPLTCPVSFTPSEWRIIRKSSGSWPVVARGGGGGEQRQLSNGETHEWSLSLAPHPTPQTDAKTFITAGLSEGTFKFKVPGRIASDISVTWAVQFTIEKQSETGAETSS